jgi:uncharacterized membrane protein
MGIPFAGARRVLTAGLGVLCGLDAVVGLWALLAPRGFYDSFPGGGLRWVAPLGPYSAHLVTDVGGGYLMMAALLGLAIGTRHRLVTRVALVAVLFQAVPHLIWHLLHLRMLAPASATTLVSTLVLATVLPIGLLPLTAGLPLPTPADRESSDT